MNDLISRQAAIDALNKMKIYRPLDSDRYVISDCLNKIVNLPSAQQEPIKININHELTKDEYEKLRKELADAPIVLLSERKTGRWIDEGQYGDNFPHHAWRCSECGEHVIEIDTPWYKYCPNCGAKMEEGEE